MGRKPKMTETNQTSESVTNLSQTDIVMAAKNDSIDSFEFGGVQYKVLDLEYDAYIEFVEYLAPFFEALISSSTGSTNFDISQFIKFAAHGLPRMVYLMTHKQNPEITEAEIKKIAKNPYALAQVAIRQVVKNKMIEEFSSFFVYLSQTLGTLS